MNLKKYFSLCIWGVGPGRPFDNEYVLENESYDDNVFELLFADGEKCIIMNPVGVINTEDGLKIEMADKILWTQHFYGKPKSEETFITIQYEWIGNGNLCVTESGLCRKAQNISVKNRIAFDSHIRVQP